MGDEEDDGNEEDGGELDDEEDLEALLGDD
jgi:hypothetical protein